MTCERCGFGTYMRAWPVDEPTCYACGHTYRSPEELQKIAEIAAEPPLREGMRRYVELTPAEKRRKLTEYSNRYQKARRAR